MADDRPLAPTRSRSSWVARTLSDRWQGFALVAALVVVWEILARLGVLPRVSLPPASAVLSAVADSDEAPVIAASLGRTLMRVFMGFALASAAGVILGVGMGASQRIYRLLEPVTELLRPIPVSALVPVAILFLGIRDTMKVSLIVYAAIWPVLINTVRGVRETDPVLVGTAQTFGMGRQAILYRVRLPAAAPYIAAGMRVSLAVALVVAVVAEMIAGGDGIGVYLLRSQRAFRTPEMYAALVSLAVTGYLLNGLFLVTERRLVFWSEQAHL